MPIIQNYAQPVNNEADNISGILKLVLAGGNKISQNKQDAAYRKSAAKLLGVEEADLNSFQRDELKDIVKEGYKNKITPKEWKPSTKEEAMELKKAEYEGKVAFEKIKDKIKMGLLDEENLPAGNSSSGNNLKSNINIGGALRNILGGASQIGNNINPISGFLNMIRPQSSAAPDNSVPASDVAASTTQPQPELTGNILIDRKNSPADLPTDPIAARIEEAIGSGMDPAEVKRQLIEKGVDPTTYGL
jgi:hypothetical protein